MPDPLILYAAVSQLAYALGERYYRGSHYVWCAPPRSLDPYGFRNPPSSDPLSIYWTLHSDVEGGDEHSRAIEGNKVGLLRGASAKEQQGIITPATRALIETIVARAQITDFKPLLLVIPYAPVRDIVKPAEIGARAKATSEEYIIEALPRDSFDVLEIHR